MTVKGIYLDNNSTTQMLPEVVEAMNLCRQVGYLNPASQHRFGQFARKKLEETRSRIVSLLGGQSTGMQADQLIFTSGGTESNNLALVGLSANEPGGRVLVSAIEHPSVSAAAEQLKRVGFEVEIIPVDQQGICRIDELERLLDLKPTTLVSVMLANNETGVIQPIREISQICRDRNIFCHIDAVQAVAKLPVNFTDLGVDAMTFTAHKFHGPRGIGGLLLKHGTPVEPIMYGGFQQMATRPGTEDVCLAVGMCQALELYEANPNQRYEHLRSLRDALESALVAEFDGMVINGGQAERTPHTLNVSFPGIDRQSFLMAADVEGLAISTGSACASGSSEPSPVLIAMGAEKEVVEGAIRISVGALSTWADIEAAIQAFSRIIGRLKPSN